MDTTKQTIIEKIKALRAKVNNAASTEAEVEAAARMVAKLMMQHDVDEDLLREKVVQTGAHAATDPLKNEMDVALRYCWQGIEKVTETKSYRGYDGRFNYIGLAHDVEMALYLFELVTMSAKRGWLRHSAKMFDEDGAMRTKHARASFYIGYGTRMGQMLMTLHEERQAARSVSTGTAVVIRKQDIIKGKMREMGIELRKSRAQGPKVSDGGAFHAGQTAASQVNLNRPFGANKTSGAIK